MADWIVEELTAKYQIPRRLGRVWLRENGLALLLDGFDEVPDKYRGRCAKEINDFRETHGLSSIVVCSRTAAYRDCGVRLIMGGATLLCPFTDAQVDIYLEAAGPDLTGLRAAVRQNDALREMARSPLMLRVMCSAYANRSADELLAESKTGANQIEEAHGQLYETYVQRMFRRRGRDVGYSSTETRGWLSWLAGQMNRHSQDVFLIEQIQPSWLPSRGWRWVYLLAAWLLNGLFGSIIMWLLTLLLQGIVPWPDTAFRSILISNVLLFFRPPGSWWLTFAWGMAEAVLFVIITRYTHGRTFNTEIRIVEALSWSWRRAAKGLGYGLLLGLVSEFIETSLFQYNGILNTVFTFGTAGLILGGLQGTRVETRNRPNEGIRLAVKNALVAGLITGVSMIVVTWLASRNDERALFTGLMLGMFALFLFGLGNAAQHFLVRLILWRKHCIPWRLTRLLDASANLILMRKVGSGYMYVHRTLQDYLMVVAE
jgi:MFS family permease